MKEILKKDWEYVLYQNEESYFISVVCGTTAIYDVFFELSAQETKLFLEKGEDYIKTLANQVCGNSEEYIKRKK
ncbi:MAG: hypothetical protein EAZ20_02350 [Bacteroidetes bacterium]|nr:MAG: hypothetical protein EAZ20_02350 [Bacteroidota bacterium]